MPRKRGGPPRKSYYKKKFYFSIRQRMLLHLSMYTQYENELEVPDEITQFGIADVVRAGRSTCSKILQEMEDKGWLYGRRAHVPSGKIRRTAYFLTPRGRIEAAKVREKVERTTVKVRDISGELKKLRVVDIPEELPVYGTLVDVVCHISRAIFDVEKFTKRAKARRGRVAHIGTMPRIPRFVDRENERKALSEWLSSPTRKILILHGLPGTGKTTLAGRLANDEKRGRNVFWYACREWSTPRHVARELGAFLARLNKTDVLRYVDTHEVLDMTEVLYLLEKNLAEVPALMIFDDYNKTGGNLDPFFAVLREMIERVDGPKLLISTRALPKFYDRRDVKVKELVAELSLEGLDRQGARTLLSLKNIPEEDFDVVFRKTQGHPLFIELMHDVDASDTRDVDKFLDEQLYSRLLDVERRVLGLASVFRRPVHVDALFMEEGVDFIVVTSMSDQSFLKETKPRVFDIHDVIRSFFYGRLGPAKRRRYHSLAAKFYTSRGGPDNLVEAIHHLSMSDNADGAARVAAQHGQSIIGAGLLDSFSQVLQGLKEKEPKRKIEIELLEGHILNIQGEWDKALSILKPVADTARRSGQGGVEAEARLLMGEVLLNRGDHVGAEEELEKSLRLYVKAGDPDGQANSHYYLGFLRNQVSEFMEAYRHFRKGMRLVLQSGNRALQAKLLYAFGVNYRQRGNNRKSTSYKLRSLAILEEVRDLRQLAKVYTGLGTSYQELGDWAEAMRYYRKAIEFSRLIGDQRVLAYALQDAASIHLARDDIEKAEAFISEASTIFHRIGEKRKMAWSQLYGGMLDYVKGKAGDAVSAWESGLKQLAAVKDRRGAAMFNLTIARIYLDEGDVVSAQKHLDLAERTGKEIGSDSLLTEISKERSFVDSMKRGEMQSPPAGSRSKLASD